MRAWFVAIGLVGMLGLVPNVCALGLLDRSTDTAPFDPTPNAPNAIHAHYHLGLRPSLDGFDVQIRLNVMEVELQGPEGVSAQAIRDGGPATQALFEQAVRERIQGELKRAFPESTPKLGDVSFRYGSSDGDADLYRPGIEVLATAGLPLSASLLGITSSGGTDGAEWARAFFYSGGLARIERSLQVPAGFDVGLKVSVPDTLRLASPGPRVGTIAEFSKNNMRGFGSLPLYVRFEVSLLEEQVPANVRAGPLVHATLRADDATPLWLQAIPFTSGRYVADLDLQIELPSLPAGMFEEGLLPGNLHLTHLSADLVRLAVRDEMVGAEQLEAYFQTVIEQSLREDFGDDLVITMESQRFQDSLRQPLGGPDVQPILVGAQARLPIQDDQMLSSSSIARSIGMITGTGGRFDLKNEGDWRLQLTLLYPEGASIKAHDSLGRLQELDQEGREGFTVYLGQGEETQIRVWGRPPMDVAVLGIGLLELAILVVGAIYLTRLAKDKIQARRFPWSPRRA